MKVLVVGMTFNPGGMESCIMNYYRHISPDKIQFDFLCNWETMAYADEVRQNGSVIYTIPQKSHSYRAYIAALDKFFQENAQKYDAIWYNTCTLTNIDYLVYAKKYGIKKRIIHAHNSGNETSALRGFLHYINRVRIGSYATDFWSCSMAASKYFYNDRIISSSKHRIINNAIDTEKYQYDDSVRKKVRYELGVENCYVIGHVGRFQYQKNHEFLIDIFNEYTKINPQAKLLLVGQGETEDVIRQKVTSLNLQSKVLFLGVRTDVNELMQAMDVFVLPSRFEGLPLVLIEAQTTGLACLTSKDKVSYEANVTNNVEYINLTDNPKEWAEHIRDLSVQTYNRSIYREQVIKAGYDISEEAQKVEILFTNDQNNIAGGIK